MAMTDTILNWQRFFKAAELFAPCREELSEPH